MKKGCSMEKQPSRVESYVPTATFYDGKREAAGAIFQDRFAVVDINEDFLILAFRGKGLQTGSPLSVEREIVLPLRQALAKGERVLIKSADGSAIFFGDWMYNGLVPVLLLPDACASLSAAAVLIFHNEIVTIGTAEPSELSKRELSELCLRFSDTLAECDRVFPKEKPEQFRGHAARIAAFAGCRADFSDLSFDPFPLSEPDTRKWTLLLLCLFLSLRGSSGDEPSVFMREIGREMLLPGVDFSLSRDAGKQTDKRFSFLRHPAFREVELETMPQGLRLSVVLSRRPKQGELCAAAPAVRLCFFLEIA